MFLMESMSFNAARMASFTARSSVGMIEFLMVAIADLALALLLDFKNLMHIFISSLASCSRDRCFLMIKEASNALSRLVFLIVTS